MAPFEFQSYRNPYVQGITDLLLRPGDVQADALRQAAAAQARATQIGSQAWAGAAQNIGQATENAIQNVTDPRFQLERDRARMNTQAEAITARINNIVNSIPVQENGARVIDSSMLTNVINAMKAQNIPLNFQNDTVKLLEENNAAFEKFATIRTDHLADLANRVLTNPHGVTPETFELGVGLAKANNLVTDDQLRPIIDAVANGRDLTDILSEVRKSSGKYSYLDKPIVLPRDTPGLFSLETGKVTPIPLPAKTQTPTEASFASDLSSSDPVVVARAKTALDALKAQRNPPAPKGFQAEWGVVDKKQVPIAFDPTTGKRYDATGKDVTDRVQPIPPAQIQVTNLMRGEAAQAPEVDANRPDPLTANRIDPKTGMTPNAIYQAGADNALTGKIPPLGYGQSPMAMAIRTGVTNKGSAMAAAAGVDVPTLRAEYRANAVALAKLLPQARATAGFAGAAIDNLNLALGQSDAVARTGAKLPNRFLQWAQGNLTPATGLTKFETYIYTGAREYAKVVSGGALSAQGLTDSAQREASKLLNAAQSPSAFAAAIQAMEDDMGNVTANQMKQLAATSTTIANFVGAMTGTTRIPPQSEGRGGTTQEMIEAVDPQGNLHHAPAGTPLPPGWKLK